MRQPSIVKNPILVRVGREQGLRLGYPNERPDGRPAARYLPAAHAAGAAQAELHPYVALEPRRCLANPAVQPGPRSVPLHEL